MQLAEGLAGLPGVAAVGLTTNGIALQRKLPALKAAGARPRTGRSLRPAVLHVGACVNRVDWCRGNSGTEDGRHFGIHTQDEDAMDICLRRCPYHDIHYSWIVARLVLIAGQFGRG